MNQPKEQSPETCGICGHLMIYASSAQILGRHLARYFSCPDCRFLRTEKPYWLTEAYSQAIAATDTGIVQRNLAIARQLTCLLPRIFGNTGRFLDVAGGTGLLTRLMRDNGFDFYWEDIYCQNILACGFEGAEGAANYQAVTAFEALEHMEQPYEFIKSCVARTTTKTFIFSTELFEPPLPSDNWWYFSRATGQHISFFSAQTLQRIAQQLHLYFVSYRGLHLLTAAPISQKAFCEYLEQEDRGLYEKIRQQRSGFTIRDHDAMTRKALGLPPLSAANDSAGTSHVTDHANDNKPVGSGMPTYWPSLTIKKLKQGLKRTLCRLTELNKGKARS